MVWFNLGVNPGLLGYRQTLYPLGQWAGLDTLPLKKMEGKISLFTHIETFNIDIIHGNGYFGGACSVMVIVIGNGHGDTSSNPGRDWLHFT